MTTAAYIRTSTSDQDGQAQRRELERALAARGIQEVEWCVDLGQSGAKATRPALSKLLQAAHEGRIRVVYIYALDRLGRSLQHLITLMANLEASGCTLVSLREALDLSTPAGRLQVHLLSAFAEFEREMIRERVRSGVAKVKADGMKLGAPMRFTADQLADARELRAKGVSWRAISRQVGMPVRTLRRWLPVPDLEIVRQGTWRHEARKARG